MSNGRKNKIEMRVIRGNHKPSQMPKPDLKLFQEQVRQGKIPEKRKNPAMVISLVDYPIEITYDGKGMMLSPRERMSVGDHQKLDKNRLPKGKVALKLLPAVKVKSEEKVEPPKVKVEEPEVAEEAPAESAEAAPQEEEQAAEKSSGKRRVSRKKKTT